MCMCSPPKKSISALSQAVQLCIVRRQYKPESFRPSNCIFYGREMM